MLEELTPEILARFGRHLMKVRVEEYFKAVAQRAMHIYANQDRPAWMRSV